MRYVKNEVMHIITAVLILGHIIGVVPTNETDVLNIIYVTDEKGERETRHIM